MKRSEELFTGSGEDALRHFIRDRKARFNWFRRVLVEPDRTRIIDVNRHELVFPGISFEHPLLELLLKESGASYDPTMIHVKPELNNGVREYGCGACYPWAHDRIS